MVQGSGSGQGCPFFWRVDGCIFGHGNGPWRFARTAEAGAPFGLWLWRAFDPGTQENNQKDRVPEKALFLFPHDPIFFEDGRVGRQRLHLIILCSMI
jgi:hypothetical protein